MATTGRNINTKRYNGPGAHSRAAPDVSERCGIPVKVVHMAYPTSNSNVSMKAPITMPSFPWTEVDVDE